MIFIILIIALMILIAPTTITTTLITLLITLSEKHTHAAKRRRLGDAPALIKMNGG